MNGGVAAFLCGGGGKPACPQGSGTVTGTIVADDVQAIAAQSLAAKDIAALIRAIKAGYTYANVHTRTSPAARSAVRSVTTTMTATPRRPREARQARRRPGRRLAVEPSGRPASSGPPGFPRARGLAPAPFWVKGGSAASERRKVRAERSARPQDLGAGEARRCPTQGEISVESSDHRSPVRDRHRGGRRIRNCSRPRLGGADPLRGDVGRGEHRHQREGASALQRVEQVPDVLRDVGVRERLRRGQDSSRPPRRPDGPALPAPDRHACGACLARRRPLRDRARERARNRLLVWRIRSVLLALGTGRQGGHRQVDRQAAVVEREGRDLRPLLQRASPACSWHPPARRRCAP